MGFESIPRRPGDRAPKVRARCDVCGCEREETCNYKPKRARTEEWEPDTGQMLRKITGWTLISNTLRCPDCEAARKAPKKDLTMKTAQTAPSPSQQPPREPTRAQKRAINDLLTSVYDTEGLRYRDAETDKTVADTIGEGCMPAWVAEIREEFFGPAGSAELEELTGALIQIIANTTKTITELGEVSDLIAKNIKAAEADRTAAKALAARVEAMKQAIGPKARSI